MATAMDVARRIEAVVRLDPELLGPTPRGLSHPAERYRREPWAVSNVVPFPAAANMRALARIAVDIVSGRRPGGIESAVMRRARDLHLLQVPVEAARDEIAEYAGALTEMVETAKERQHVG